MNDRWWKFPSMNDDVRLSLCEMFIITHACIWHHRSNQLNCFQIHH
jgi:hypothetical protein